jgi:hypothetical protein
MDKIQKELIKAGRKDLAQEYYKKIAKTYLDFNDIKVFRTVLLNGEQAIGISFNDEIAKLNKQDIQSLISVLKAFAVKSNLASDILKVAQDIQFTVKKPLKVKEDGLTRTSLKNAEMIYDADYELVSAIMSFNKTKAIYKTDCIFRRDNETVSYTFDGFSLGYNGEGPRGLASMMKLFGFNVDDFAFGNKQTPDSGVLRLQ